MDKGRKRTLLIAASILVARKLGGRAAGSADDVGGGVSVEETVKDLWIADSPWQNFSSMFREAITARDARTGMERAHHLTASLYFGIAALEAFLNEKMREHLSTTKSQNEILRELKGRRTIWKLKRWPVELLGKHIETDESVITYFNAPRRC